MGTKISQAILIAKNYKEWRHWRKVRNGIKTMDFARGGGYYITIGLLGYNPIGKVEEIKMKSGKIGVCELVDYEVYRDPDDMIKESYWHLSGYKGIKAIKDCSFREMLELYPNLVKR